LTRMAEAAIFEPGRSQGEEARRLDLREHVGEAEADGLEGVDRLTEGGALRSVVTGRLERCSGDADGLRRDPDTAAVEPGERDDEALALRPQTGGFADEAVVERDRGRDRGVLTELLLGLAEGEPCGSLLDQEGADTTGAGRRVGLGHDQVELRLTARGDPGFSTVQQVATGHALRLGGHGHGIGTRMGFREAEGPDPLAAGQTREVGLALRLATVARQQVSSE